MLRKLATILLLLVFVVQTFNKPFIVLDYFANTAAYAKNCVNKARPTMHCNGKCQMMKKLQEQDKKDKEAADRKANDKTEIVSSSETNNYLQRPDGTLIVIDHALSPAASIAAMPRDCFHPPTV